MRKNVMGKDEIGEIIERLDEIRKEKISIESSIEMDMENIESIETSIYLNEAKIDDLDSEAERLKRKIENIKHIKMSEDNNQLPNDDFHNTFIELSMFTRMQLDNTSGFLNYVKVEGDRMIATDGYRVLIANLEIPSEFKNSIIRWDERDNVEVSMLKTKQDKIVFTFEVDNFLLDSAPTGEKFNMSVYDFYEKHYVGRGDMDVFNISGVNIGFNRKFMNDAKRIFGDSDTQITYPNDEYSPILIKNSKYTMVILPIRLNG